MFIFSCPRNSLSATSWLWRRCWSGMYYIFYVHFCRKVLVSNIWRIFTLDIGTTIHNVSFLFLYLFYISGFVDCETLHGKVKCSLCFPCKKTDICSIQIKEGSRTRGVCLFILAVFLKNYVQIKTKRISSGHIRTNRKIIHCIKLFTLSQSSPHFNQVKCS